ncbi:hypothetical protein FRB90_003660 [Tulasnella sp. 427]|nr:hypothetical protein FRB90_003660 [Tulasnella sp. 427]
MVDPNIIFGSPTVKPSLLDAVAPAGWDKVTNEHSPKRYPYELNVSDFSKGKSRKTWRKSEVEFTEWHIGQYERATPQFKLAETPKESQGDALKAIWHCMIDDLTARGIEWSRSL